MAPVASRTGTAAFLSSPRGDSLHVQFINPEGNRLGTWSTVAESLGVNRRLCWSRREFLPRSDTLAILGTGRSRDHQWPPKTSPVLRLISSDGHQLWSRDLQSLVCDELYLGASGNILVAYGPGSDAKDIEADQQDHEFQVFDARGSKVARIQGHGRFSVLRIVVDSGDRFLYYDTGDVRAFDLMTGEAVSTPGEEALLATMQSDDPEDARRAATLLARLREQTGGK